ncbi:MAG: hypothetical protein IT299_05965 [Dehalococcoidia bacterium]|nr:hypothetical protein [Dehalococcoidia bacterium]
MSQRSQRDRERALDEALEGSGLARSVHDSEDAELEDLLALTSELRDVRNSLPDIDERQVWLRVRSGMLEQPQRSTPRGLWQRLLPVASFTPRLVMASVAGLLLFVGAALASLLMQPAGNASAAFIERLDSIEGASALVADLHEVPPGERARIEREAFELLDLASKPGVLGDVPPAEAEAIRTRLANVRGSLASVLNEEVSEARTLAALAAVSGLITSPPAQVRATESPAATVTPSASPSPVPTVEQVAPVVTATATPSPAPTRTPSPTSSATASPTPRPSASPTPSPSPERTPSPTASPAASATPGRPSVTPTASASPVVSPTQPPTQRPSQAEAAARSTALARAQSLCAKVVDRASLEACANAGAQAQESCPASDPTCLAVLEGLVDMAQERLDRMRDGCRRLSTSKARAACEDATRIDGGRRSNLSYEGDSPSSEGTPIPTEIPTRGSGFNSRRDW